MSDPGPREGGSPRAVIAVASNKGGVGKTTVSTNLAVYLRALHEDLPVLLVGLDDQSIIDRMFRLRTPGAGEGNLKHGFAERCLDRVIQMGQYGIHFVPTPPDTAPLKGRAEDPRTLGRVLAHTAFDGVAILDTKSDLEALTANALAAADLVILPVSDRASLEEAGKAFALLERLGRGAARGRVLFTLVDRRTRVDRHGRDLLDRLTEEVDARGWPRFRTWISRSPRLEALNSGSGVPGSVLHHARGTPVHRQLRELAEEVGALLSLEPAAGPPTPSPAPAEPLRSSGGLKDVLLRGLRRG